MGTTAAQAVPQTVWLGAGETVELRNIQATTDSYASSFIPTTTAPATRTEGLGAYKWALANSAILTSGTFTLVLGWIPSFASINVALVNKILLHPGGGGFFMRQSNEQVIQAFDLSGVVTRVISTYSSQDSIILCLVANNTASAINDTPANTMQLITRNLSKGESIVVASAAYDGAFNATTFLQFLKAAGGNNSALRNLRQYDTCIPHADITANFT